MTEIDERDPVIIAGVARIMAAIVAKDGIGMGARAVDYEANHAKAAKSLYAALANAHITDRNREPAQTSKEDEEAPSARRKGHL